MEDQPQMTDAFAAQRINGFAPGDRVAIVNCEMAGAYGRVVHSYAGCTPLQCRDRCRIVYVDMIRLPKGMVPSESRSTGLDGGNPYRFKVCEVNHVD